MLDESEESEASSDDDPMVEDITALALEAEKDKRLPVTVLSGLDYVGAMRTGLREVKDCPSLCRCW